MPVVTNDPLERVLRLCADAAPDPWYPRRFARQAGADAEVLGDILEFLFLEGLVQAVDRKEPADPGFRLTPLGERVLREEPLLERLRRGEAVVEHDTGARIRQTLRRPTRPVVNVVMLVLNLLFFAYGLALAMRQGGSAGTGFLTGAMMSGTQAEAEALLDILHRNGSVSGTDILRGEWWRLMTAAFCHRGLLHLGMNMYGLWVLGRIIEGRWGSWRYLIICLLGAWTGSCLGVAFTPQASSVGASGALCGVLGAELFWVVVTGRYLPRSMVRRERSVMVINVVLLVFISLLPGVSGWGHLGGAIGGFLAAAVLFAQRFGPVPLRWLAVAALLPLPWLGWAVLDQTRARSETWQQLGREIERESFNKEIMGINGVLRPAWQRFSKEIEPAVDRHPDRREGSKVESALAAIADSLPGLRSVRDRLLELGPYRDEKVEAGRRAALASTETLLEVYERSERCLKEKGRWKMEPVEKAEEAWEAWEGMLK